LGCPHIIKFSGKGFHIIVPHINFDVQDLDNCQDENTYTMFSRIAHKLKKLCSYVDTSIYDPRRLSKMPHSLALYKDHAYVSDWIYSEDELINFSLKQYELGTYPIKTHFPKIKYFGEKSDIKELINYGKE